MYPISPVQPFHILLIDDHAMFRTGLRMILEMEMTQMAVSEAESLAETFDMSAAPDLILLDIQLPGLNGLEAMASLKQRWPGSAIIVVSALHATSNVELAYEQGAAAFISKTEPSANIVRIIEQIRGGQASDISEKQKTTTRKERPRLTPHQCDVLELLCRGHPNKVIARKLDLSENTVRWHVQALLEILDASCRSEAIFLACSKGLIL
ncbi:response regulator [Sedimenticola hydrogenitrophicus]|uniref:response regulator n=1 Tax=Sedimenticola hydrogenitrophicus TaxID=2967975 RepID=UPI0021A64A29|nr:response regulator transcription factor [Sedimenticola hydrogenitrophicus]